MLPMGTACTGPESLQISVAISLPSFLPSCPVTNTLIIGPGSSKAEGKGRTDGRTGSDEQNDRKMKTVDWKVEKDKDRMAKRGRT